MSDSRHHQHQLHRFQPNIVVIGGGTGSFTLLQSLKKLTPNITALVNMVDDGGSTGILRDELGVLPPGDVRKTLVALSQSPQVMRDLFNYRFEEGTFGGHTFGNIFLTAMEKVTGNFGDAVETASQVLKITGRVIPVTLDNVRLVLEVGEDSSASIYGEGKIDVIRLDHSIGRPKLRLDPVAIINPEAATAIANADVVVISAGDLYTSLGPSLIVNGVAESLINTNAKTVYVCNLVVKPGHTDGFSVADHASEIERFVGAPFLDYVLYNTEHPAPEVLQQYVNEGELLVESLEGELSAQHYSAIGQSFISKDKPKVDAHDRLAKHRSLIRHDAAAVVRVVHKLLTDV